MMAARNQKKVEKAMRDAMKSDRAKYDVTRISKLGLLEISRQRIKAEKMGASYATCPVCEGYGLVKNVEPAGLAALRKLQARCLRNDFGKVSMRVPPEIAHWILNHKRDDLSGLERRHAIRVLVEPKAIAPAPRERVRVLPAREGRGAAGARGGRSSRAADAARSRRHGRAAAAPAAAAARRRRAAAGRPATPTRQTAATTGERAPSAGGAGAAEAARGAEADGRGCRSRPRSGADTAAAARCRAGTSELDGRCRRAAPTTRRPPSAGAPDGPPARATRGQPRRRRRRGRRGRGTRQGGRGSRARRRRRRSRADAVGSPRRSKTSRSVPRGVVAHELMPAATAGARGVAVIAAAARRRAGLGGEPVDPQLISPSNPVPKPGFDED